MNYLLINYIINTNKFIKIFGCFSQHEMRAIQNGNKLNKSEFS